LGGGHRHRPSLSTTRDLHVTQDTTTEKMKKGQKGKGNEEVEEGRR